jgi:hypothetical protein
MVIETTTKERPIIFSGPMVRAMLAGHKTQTRRILKLPKWADQAHGVELHDKAGQGQSAIDWPNAISRKTGCLAEIPCPYGIPGERLWVKETMQLGDAGGVVFSATPDVEVPGWRERLGNRGVQRVSPAMFLPRAASRITLQVVAVQAMRLQEISEDDAIAEGADGRYMKHEGGKIVRCSEHGGIRPVDQFKARWDELHGAGAWDFNPLVWAITFKRLAAA